MNDSLKMQETPKVQLMRWLHDNYPSQNSATLADNVMNFIAYSDHGARDYRDRLDRMVAACAAGDCANPNAGNWKPRDMVAYAQVLLAAIDEAVREKQDDAV